MADEGWIDETRSAYFYRVVAEVQRGSPRSSLFLELAREAEGQAAISAKNAGLAAVPVYEPDLRTRIVASPARRYGPRMLVIGGSAEAITYFVGRLLGVSLS